MACRSLDQTLTWNKGSTRYPNILREVEATVIGLVVWAPHESVSKKVVRLLVPHGHKRDEVSLFKLITASPTHLPNSVSGRASYYEHGECRAWDAGRGFSIDCIYSFVSSEMQPCTVMMAMHTFETPPPGSLISPKMAAF